MAEPEDLLNTVDRQIVTSEAPRNQISAGQIEQPFREMQGALDKWSNATMDLAVPLAERQAAQDLQQQKVTRDADGNVHVLNPANSILFGRAGEAYGQAVKT